MTAKKQHFKKIAVVRANGLGDFVFALPSLNALREANPEAEIVYLGKNWHQKLLVNHKELVNRVIVIPPVYGVGEEFTDQNLLPKFLESMKQEYFDLAVQLHGGGKYSNPFTRGLGAKITIGLKSKDAAYLDSTIPYLYYQNEVMRCLEVVSLVGADTKKIEPHLQISPQELLSAKPFLPGTPYVVIHPGATDSRRRWPIAKFAKIAEFLDKLGFRVVVVGLTDEFQLSSSLASLTSTPFVDLVGKITLPALAGILFQAQLVVANDSGPLHLARALGTPNVGIFWCGNLINAGPLTREKNIPVISWQINCSACGTNMATTGIPFSPSSTCLHNESFVSSVRTDEVLENIIDLLSIYKTNYKEVLYV